MGYRESENDFLKHLESLKDLNLNADNRQKEILEVGIKLRYMFLMLFGKCILYFPEKTRMESSSTCMAKTIPAGYEYVLTEKDSSALKAAGALFVSVIISIKKEMENRKEIATHVTEVRIEDPRERVIQ